MSSKEWNRMTDDQKRDRFIEEYNKHNGKKNWKAVCEALGIGRALFYQYKRMYITEGAPVPTPQPPAKPKPKPELPAPAYAGTAVIPRI